MSDADKLYAAIAHGDEDHRAWLKDACQKFFAGEPVPPPTGKGRAEAAEAERDRLQARVEKMEAALEKWRFCYDDGFDDHMLVKKVGPMMADCIHETRTALQQKTEESHDI